MRRPAADLRDLGQRRSVVERVRATHLLHLAWSGIPGALWCATESASRVAATNGLMQDFAHTGGERAALAGSCGEYDRSAARPLRQDAPIAPAMDYGVCKDVAGRVMQGLGETLGRVARGRVFFLYGPGEDERRLVAGLARALVWGERVATSAGEQVRDFLHVDDVAAAFAALAAADLTGVVNIGASEGVAVRRIVDLGAAAGGRPDLLDVGARPPRAGEPPELVAGATRLTGEVGFVSSIVLADGLAATVAWRREHAGAAAASDRGAS